MTKIISLVIYTEESNYDKMKKMNDEYLLYLHTHTKITQSVQLFYIVYKKLELELEYILNGNILYINGEETYIPGILNKTVHAMEILTYKLNIEYDFILRTNCSTVINFQQCINYINTLNINIDTKYYIGPYNCLTWYDHTNGIIDNTYHGTRFCGGAFILINKPLVLDIINNKDKLVYTLIDDVSIGQYINTIPNIIEICVKDNINFNYKDNINNINFLAYFNNTNKLNRIIDVNNFKTQIDIITTNINNKYSIVLPINPNTNISQCIINIKLLYKNLYMEDIYKIYIITSIDHINRINKQIINIDIYNKIEFINECFINPIIPNQNWIYQQILKLKISSLIKTRYYLILDIDMYLIKSLKYTDLFYENKIIYSHECFPHNNPPGYTNNIWWNQSCNLLDYNIKNLYDKNNLMGVTPQLLDTQIVKDLLIFLEQKYGVNWINIAIQNKFTEYSLYWIYIIITQNEHLYTQFGNPLLDVDESNSVLHPSDHKTIINTIQNLLTYKKYHFLLIQGWLQIDFNSYIDLLPI